MEVMGIIETGWALQLQQYRGEFLEYANIPTRGTEANTGWWANIAVAMDLFDCGGTPSQDDESMLEDKTTHLTMGCGDSDVRPDRLLSQKNLKLLRKRPGAPKYVREFMRRIRQMASEKAVEAEFGMVEVKIWEVLPCCDEKGKKYLKEEDILRRAKKKAWKKKEKKREKKKRARETRKKSSRKT